MNISIIAGLARHLLTALGGGLVSKGLLTEPTLDTGVGAALTLAGVVMSVVNKKRANKSAP
jgi:hypothetical protein